MWTISIKGVEPVVVEKGLPLTSGSANVPIKFVFDEYWAAMEKTVVFTSRLPESMQNGETADIVIGSGESEVTTKISGSVLKNSGKLLIGVFGVAPDKSIASVYCTPLCIHCGAIPSGEEVDQSDPLYAQLMRRLQEVPTNGKDGTDGRDGRDGIDGKDGKDGKDGRNGIDGVDGSPGVYYGPNEPTDPSHPVWIDTDDEYEGKDSITPVKGVDFWTETDKAEIVASVVSQLVDGNEVYY